MNGPDANYAWALRRRLEIRTRLQEIAGQLGEIDRFLVLYERLFGRPACSDAGRSGATPRLGLEPFNGP